MTIPLYVDDGVAYVWNSRDWYDLRTKHRVCGSLIGSIASFPRQNDFLGLPMALMSEETALLVEKGVCILVDLPYIKEKPSEDEKQHRLAIQKRLEDEQAAALRKRKIEQISQKIDIIVAGKKQKLLAKGIRDITVDKETLLQEEVNKVSNLAPGHVLIHTPTEHVRLLDKTILSVTCLKPSIFDPEGRCRFAVYKDLWERGYYITSGSKFSSHYIVYPGDPVRFHAMYMVRCIHDKKQMFLPKNVVAFGRLSVAVNKLAVIAFSNDRGYIEYQTLQWHDSVHS